MTDNFMPKKLRVLSGSTLKLIAVITMLIDHTASVLLAKKHIVLFTLAGRSLKLNTVMHLVGRIAFPVYAFLIVEGFIHTHDRKKYGINLLAFAFISEIPWNLEHAGKLWMSQSQNVFFTLFFGYIGLCILEKYSSKPLIQLIGLAVITFVAAFTSCDYGCSGFILIVLLYVMKNSRVLQTVTGTCILSSKLLKFGVFAGFLLISMYNGERGFIKGRFFKYLFYAIYPAHMLILYFLKKKYIGY